MRQRASIPRPVKKQGFALCRVLPPRTLHRLERLPISVRSEQIEDYSNYCLCRKTSHERKNKV